MNQCFFLQSYWDWLPLELKEYVLALAEAQHKIDLERKRQWKCVLDEMDTYHRYKEAWGLGTLELKTFTNCICRRSRHLHTHVEMEGKFTFLSILDNEKRTCTAPLGRMDSHYASVEIDTKKKYLQEECKIV